MFDLNEVFKKGGYKGISAGVGMVVGYLVTEGLIYLGKDGNLLSELRKDCDEYDKKRIADIENYEFIDDEL
ncbi:hypothetical protein [Clostridium gasigenes]|uniref:Uncharacterized protein n=1 Tax=Clostridium gasigenes TaxID=94869 RepID=A0A1H0S2D9_9CLOT|nr:hypothetical protein [Clostridium gasigenes]SDP35903.1 hypothetical protein SAMN04488529_104130 [Clostridium gasigenes]